MIATQAATAASPVQTHPVYRLWETSWRKLAHTYEGSGGYLDGTYLVPHPREWEDYNALEPSKPTKKLIARRKLARYENVAAAILDAKKAAIFREVPTRLIGGKSLKDADHPLRAWWSNVDGGGCAIDDWMRESWITSAIFGHTVHVMDRPQEDGEAPLTKADEGALYLRAYTPLDMPDWLTNDRGQLTAVKLLELVTRASLDDAPVQDLRLNFRQRLLTETTWELRENTVGVGTTSGAKPHAFGRLPVVILYANRRAWQPVVGKSVLNDPNLFIDLYNLTSEIRELLRAQTFGWLNVELGTGDTATTVEKAQELLGTGAGTDNVLFSPGPANFIQPDAANVQVYQGEREALLRTIYRLCAIPWESDSMQREAAGSMKLKREDMNQILAGYADECEKAEYQMVELWFRGEYGERWKAELDKAKVVIRYPDTFDVTPFADILEQAQASLTLGMDDLSPTFQVELRRRLVAKFLPDATPDTIATIDKEIEAAAQRGGMAAVNTALTQLKARLQQPTTTPPKAPVDPAAVSEAA
jgi:hypothetical protein